VGLLRRYYGLINGKMDTALTEALAAQLSAAQAGVALSAAMVAGDLDQDEARHRMRAVEHRGDTARADLVAELSRALVTPIDREDLFRLSRSIDDVLDALRDFVRESSLYGLPDQSNLAPLLDQLAAGVAALRRAATDMAGAPEQAARTALEARKAGGAIRRLYQYELARILDGELTAQTIKQRELARRLELAGSRIGDAADAIADGTMKRWH
jgi:uncharacterized protein Yka (UPF0111/DUF47 family)